MSKSKKFDMNQMIIEACEKSYEKAFEMAVRTNTALIFSHKGKIIEVKPPFRYELVPVKSRKKKGKPT